MRDALPCFLRQFKSHAWGRLPNALANRYVEYRDEGEERVVEVVEESVLDAVADDEDMNG